MTASTAPTIVDRPAPNIIVRVIWFLLVGWWLGGILSAVAWALNATIVGMPLGLWLINRLPTFITLRSQEQRFEIVGGDLVPTTRQRSFVLRALYIVFIGWWFSGIWMGLAYLLVLS
ncbi:MAG TPA: hypothetical protein VFI22_13195, partial [Thermomicrobiales bacterium]|nr:hypothetical protein [Thermomicrobiales bacterium]